MATEHNVVANCMMLCLVHLLEHVFQCCGHSLPACLTFTEGEHLGLFESRKPTSTYKQKHRVTLQFLYPRVYVNTRFILI